jgi:DNA-directed RNA polymerase subunit RPC12/RpoP
VSYRFDGWLDEIYATLVVRLHHTRPFERDALWRNAADLTTGGGKRIGLRLLRRDDGGGELELHCEPSTPPDDQALLDGYVGEHLRARATGVTRLRTYVCPRCGTPVENRDAARRRLDRGERDIACSDCEHRIPLVDEIECRHLDPELRFAVDALEDDARQALAAESRERLLVGEVQAMARRANQIARELHDDDAFDMEIEFTTDDGEPTGRKLHLHLSAAGAYLRSKGRPHPDNTYSVVPIPSPAHASRWADAPGPVMLVARSWSEDRLEWREIGEYLRGRRAKGDRRPSEIGFDASERFDVMSIRRWRDRVLGG